VEEVEKKKDPVPKKEKIAPKKNGKKVEVEEEEKAPATGQ